MKKLIAIIILLSRGSKKYFACSAFRDRKDCDFYLEHGTKLSAQKICQIKEKRKRLFSDNNFSSSRVKIQELRQSHGLSDIEFCNTCAKVSEAPCRDNLLCSFSKLNKSDLKSPVNILQPKAQDKKEAQHFFSEKASSQIISIIRSQNFSNVLCVGCPSLFEQLPQNLSDKSLLWDIDARLESFYDHSKFLWGNFFNGHFFRGKEAEEIFRNFLIGVDTKLLIIVDPPFGAKTELISHSINRVKNQLDFLNMGASAQTIWVFPYFMERQVAGCDSALAMADLRVTYSSHIQYGQTDKARKQGSPVRIFTDIPLSSLKLSGEEYYHCDKCRVWRHVTNVHCDACATCPSKDGRTYVHCRECGRCVKPTYVHCLQCGRCCLPEHRCSEESEAPRVKEITKFTDKNKRENKKRKRPLKHQQRLKKRHKST